MGPPQATEPGCGAEPHVRKMPEFVHLHLHTEFSLLDGACRIEELLEGVGNAQCAVSDEQGRALAEGKVARPGRFSCELKFEQPGTRLVTLRVTGGNEHYVQTLRLDLMAHAWIG